MALFEGTAIGAGASERNSGSVQYPFDRVLAALHGESLERYRRLAAEAPDVFAFPDAPAGLLLLAPEGELAELEAERDTVRATAPALAPEILGAADLTRLEPTLAPDLAAVRLETGYPLPPAAAVDAFARLAERAGVRISVGEAIGLERGNGRIAGVRRRSRRVTAAGSVLVAAGPWSPAIVDPTGRWRPIVRTWGVTVAVQLSGPPVHVLEESGVEAINRGDGPPGAAPRTGEPDGHFASTFSLVTAAGVSVVGSTFLPEEPDPGSVGPLLLHRADRFVPGLHAAGVHDLRACARPQSFDGRPLLGRVPGSDNLFIAAGHGPWGISTGPATARMIADVILGRPVAIPPELDPARFPLWPGYPAPPRTAAV